VVVKNGGDAGQSSTHWLIVGRSFCLVLLRALRGETKDRRPKERGKNQTEQIDRLTT
jgi:hypothetical protein